MKSSTLAATAAIFLAVLQLYAAPAANFHCEYNQDFHALGGPGGSTPGKHSQEMLWETLAAYMRPGIVGNAALTGTSEDKKQEFNIIYPAGDILTPASGSVAFWVQPVNWDVTDKSYHVFFRARGKDAELLVYKVPNNYGPFLRFIIGPARKVNNRNIWTTLNVNVGSWKRGEWHFVVITWSKNKAAIYVDGKLGTEKPLPHLPGKFDRFGVGGLTPARWRGNPGLTLIDEVMIYRNNELTPQDVRERYSSYGRGFLGADDTTEVLPERLVTLVDIKKRTINVQFNVNRSQGDGSPFTALIEFLDAKSGKAVWQKKVVSEKPLYIVSIPEDEIPFGSFKLKVSLLRKNGKIAGGSQMDFRRPKRPEVWENNRLGKQDIVPPPWTPLEFAQKGNVIRCWNREYRFGNSILPETVTTGKTNLFNAPVQLKLDGRSITSKAAVKAEKVSPSTVKLTADSATDNFKIQSRIHAEFDGFIWFDITLTPKKKSGADVKKLTLDFQFRKETSQLFNSMTKYYLDYKPGAYGKFKSYAMDLYRVPRVMFVGNDHCGFEWVCETMPDWRNLMPQQSLQLIPGKDSNLLRLNFIDHPVKLVKPVTYSFGIQATPVRPLPAGWRHLRAGSKKADGFLPFWEATTRHSSLNPEHLRKDYHKALKDIRRIYGRELLYLAGFTNNPYYPEWPYWCLTWSKIQPDAGFYGSLNNPRAIFAWNCPVPETLRDWYLYYLDNFMKKYGHRDLYFDNQCAQLCSNAIHGCGFKSDDGKTWASYNVRATRDLTKRIYILQKSRYPDALIMRHMSSKAVTPTISFADLWLDGELYCKTVGVDEDYKKVFDPDMIRACFRSENYGVPNYFIPQFQRAIRYHSPIPNRYFKDWTSKHLHLYQDKLRHFTGYMLVNDVLVWPTMGISYDKIWEIFDRFGLNGKERFIMYNDPASPFGYKERLLMVSSFILNGKAMVIVMNDTSKPVTSLPFDPEKFKALGVNFTAAADAESGKAVTIEKNTIKYPIPARDYRIFITK